MRLTETAQDRQVFQRLVQLERDSRLWPGSEDKTTVKTGLKLGSMFMPTVENQPAVLGWENKS
jgi:hypothetical protein